MTNGNVPGPPRAGLSLAGLVACAVTGAAVLAVLGVRLRAIVPDGLEAAARTDVERWVELLVLLVGAVAAARLALGAVVALACVAAARRRGARAVDAVLGRWAPLLVRRLARGAVGVGVGAGLALTPVAALADEAPAPDAAVVLDVGWRSTAGAATPATSASAHPVALAVGTSAVPGGTSADGADRAAGAGTAAGSGAGTAAGSGPPSAGEPSEVVVVRGDTLWDIAARTLPADASDPEVLAETVRWHEANRDVIGDDADRILPGQVLRSP